MRSGELARVSGVSSDTLRHYERIGLLPKPPRTQGGYRDYPPDAIARVRMVRSALSVGFSLAELTRILKARDQGRFPCHETRKLAASKLTQVKLQIKELAGMRQQLERILRDWDSRLAQTAAGQPARLLETLPNNLPPGQLNRRFRKTPKEKN